jgi:hypothetical protein
MNKIRIRVLSPVYNPVKKIKHLRPGEYAAELNQNGTLAIRKTRGCFIPKPDQFEFIDAPEELVNLWNARMALVKAQGEYEAAWQRYQITS